MDPRLTILALSACLALAHSTAEAQRPPPAIPDAARETVRLLPADDGTVVDQFPFDGVANGLEPQFLVVELTDFEPASETLGDRRAVVEFGLDNLAGRSIRRATLELTPTFISMPEGAFIIPVEVRKYQGNGVLGRADFYRGTFVRSFDMRSLVLGMPARLDVTNSVRYALSNQWRYLGFVLRTNITAGVAFRSSDSGPPPALVITFN